MVASPNSYYNSAAMGKETPSDNLLPENTDLEAAVAALRKDYSPSLVRAYALLPIQ
jgi:ASC-1-like (ASCH) protein